MGLYLLEDRREPLFRYEYERQKGRYAPAHLHVHGQSHALGRLYGLAGRQNTADLHDVRFPVGGRRYRPSVEDVIELLLDYNLVDAKPGARERLDAERRRFHRIQLKAAGRPDPEAALEALRESGEIPDG